MSMRVYGVDRIIGESRLTALGPVHETTAVPHSVRFATSSIWLEEGAPARGRATGVARIEVARRRDEAAKAEREEETAESFMLGRS